MGLSGPTSYRVPAASGEHEIEIKRSRFLCAVRRVETEEEARATIAERRRAFHDARHTCSAFLLGPRRDVARSSDDGEPAGTAGAPMLDALSRFHGAPDLSDTVAVVTRWFGGILLGAGGLTRAYAQCVAETLERTPILTRELRRRYELRLGYGVAGRLETEIRGAGMAVTETEHLPDGVRLVLAVAAAEPPDAVAARIDALTSGRCDVTVADTAWVDLR
ncbi:IMPACT family protein [Propionicicella superfundia]|uniref:IMPACT family protein n=1 Tax=Propionicicella superfundia TaxID=348582 RepID=UPI00041F0E57